mmetsp:Transcript_12727/g.31068  ORF Transcript_12727/g.31068 Transcript_12727/m.31068 type:complete len:282 (+) Transcript_12727:340-1185(+)|eukprot:CAMPEP_0181096726 /NCGR_PEP_ID=MMETSP1071-20121207/11187_1 /TAXON_ID=35127 /ORGANISM="Thalassiosira sp., Strain NH16" /LENGTH=281 /DNA_ID=CAMNT_0023179155 /DNA_START=312 /DNA_END=1157 /DNA_ORIENTATION=+
MSATEYSIHSPETSREKPYIVGGEKDRNGVAVVSNGERHDSSDSTTGTTDNDNEQDEAKDGCTDVAAILVLIYLIFISTLLVGAIVMGFAVVIQFGLVVFVAVCAVVLAMVMVGATVMSIITRDAKLRKARSKIKSWHVACKDEILKEMNNFKEDIAAYRSSNTMLLLTNHGETGSVGQAEGSVTSDSIATSEGPSDGRASANRIDKKQSLPHTKTTSSQMKQEHRPKSLLFRAVASFTKSSLNKNATTSQRKSMKTKRSWKRKKNNNVDEAFKYQNPDIV